VEAGTRDVPLVVLLGWRRIGAQVLSVPLASLDQVDVREARDTEVARELIRNREVLTPLLGTEKLMEKPVIANPTREVACGPPNPAARSEDALRDVGGDALHGLPAPDLMHVIPNPLGPNPLGH